MLLLLLLLLLLLPTNWPGPGAVCWREHTARSCVEQPAAWCVAVTDVDRRLTAHSGRALLFGARGSEECSMDTIQLTQSPAIAAVAPGLQQATLTAFEALRCELGALDVSPAPSPSPPFATLDGNLPMFAGTPLSLSKAPGGGLQLSFRKTVSSPPGATGQQDTPAALGAALRTWSAYPPGMASTGQEPVPNGSAAATLPVGDEGMILRTHSPTSAPASPPDMPREASSPQLDEKLSQDAAMLDVAVLRLQQGMAEQARREADGRLLRQQAESAAHLAAVQQENQQRETELRKRAQEQVEHAQRIVRMEMQQEIQQAQNDAALRLRQVEQQSSEHVAAYQQQAFEMVRKATQSARAQAEELVAIARRQAEERISDAQHQCDTQVQVAEAATRQTDAMLNKLEASAARLQERLVAKHWAASQQLVLSRVLRGWRAVAQTRRREQVDGAKAIHIRALQARVNELESALVQQHRASSVEHVRHQRDRVVLINCRRRALKQQRSCFDTLVRFTKTQRTLAVTSYRAVVWRQQKTSRWVLHTWRRETEATMKQVAAYLAVAADILPKAFGVWKAAFRQQQKMHRSAAKFHQRRKTAVLRHWRHRVYTASVIRAEVSKLRAEIETSRSDAVASLALSQSSERAASEACAEAEQRVWAEAAARSAAEAQVTQLSARLVQHEQQLESAREEARRAVADARATAGDLDEARAGQARADVARREESVALQAALAEAVQKERQAVDEAHAAGQALDRARAEETRLLDANAIQARRVVELQRELAEAKERLREQSADIARLVTGSSDSRADHEATIQSLRSAVAALRDSMEAEKRRNEQNEVQLTALSKECESLRTVAQTLRLEASEAQTALAEEVAKNTALHESWQAQKESHAAAMTSLECSVMEQLQCEHDDVEVIIAGRAERAAAAVAGAKRRHSVRRCFGAWSRLVWMEMAIATAASGARATVAC